MIASHDGVFTTHQAHSHGVSADGIRHRVRTGQWVRVTRGVFRVADRTVDDRMRMRMRMRLAVLQTGPGAALAGAAAAWWHGLVSRVPDVPVVVAPHGRHGTRVEDVTVWHRTVAPRDLTEVDGLTVTGLELTALDASVELGGGEGDGLRAAEQEGDRRGPRHGSAPQRGSSGFATRAGDAGGDVVGREVGGGADHREATRRQRVHGVVGQHAGVWLRPRLRVRGVEDRHRDRWDGFPQ